MLTELGFTQHAISRQWLFREPKRGAISEVQVNARRATFLTALLVSNLQSSGASAKATEASSSPLWGYLSVVPPVETHTDARAFKPGTLSLRQAAMNLNRGRTGRVIEIGFTHTGTSSFYAATIGSSEGLRYMRIDPLTGHASATGRPAVTRAQLDAQGLLSLALLGSARITLIQAVTSAETLTGDRAIAAGVEQLNGLPQYYVQTAHSGGLADPVIVDPQTGRAALPLK